MLKYINISSSTPPQKVTFFAVLFLLIGEYNGLIIVVLRN